MLNREQYYLQIGYDAQGRPYPQWIEKSTYRFLLLDEIPLSIKIESILLWLASASNVQEWCAPYWKEINWSDYTYNME